ncbi:VOC family protein [Bacillus solimangrovi]|uniref:Glyoxalase n=1 Tax=Bacillus solimangrovi TaxID=1305675 RepID=A0A1E5LJ64_9BACI|nr:VOC family protein [Bacillus solimangrovi]OEH94127.1 glyoxalase [Bacillus solimangrovi]
MITFKRIDHVQLCIPLGKEEEARNFYCGILGMKEIEKPDSLKSNGGFWLEAGDIQLHIGTESINENKGKRHPAFEVQDIAAARKHLETAKVKINEEKIIPGIQRFSFYDPFGNRIELLEKVEG